MIRICNLSKTFGDLSVLHKISLNVPKGELVAVIGPSGSGKSTLLRCLNLLETPSEGRIFLDQENITLSGYCKEKLRQKVGMVFQHFHLFPHMTVLENVTFAPIYLGKMNQEEAHAMALSLLERVGLSSKTHVYPSKLSGGQKQRVAIARCLAMAPEVVLFDEPTSALDPEMVKEVLEVIRSFAHTGITMLIVTHEMDFAHHVADRLLFMDHGKILEDTTPEAFFKGPQTERARFFLSKVL